MGNLAIIPARGGSKRIPKKNIKPFLGKPIIAYSIEAAIQSGLFTEVMVSTDSEEIADIARQYGASVPFFRSDKNADDYATLFDVIKEVLDSYSKEGITFDNICCLLPTAPFISIEKLNTALNKLQQENLHSVFPVLEFSYPIQRSLQLNGAKVEMVWPEHLNSRSQDLPKRYHDSGQFYWLTYNCFKSIGMLFTDNSGAIIISELEAQDIDTETDWKLAELKYSLLTNDATKGSL